MWSREAERIGLDRAALCSLGALPAFSIAAAVNMAASVRQSVGI